MITVNKVVIDDPNKYKPHPTLRVSLLLNVIKDKIPLIRPTIIMIDVNPTLTLTI
jgi:hypothetical protein